MAHCSTVYRPSCIHQAFSGLYQRPKPILFFHGVGGNGKSLLLRVLNEQYCIYIQPENWKWMREAFSRNAEIVKESRRALDTKRVPTASLDFGMAPQGNDHPQEVVSALLMLRRSLGRYGLRFPLFDFSCIWYLDQTRQLGGDQLANLFPPQEMDFITMLATLITHRTWLVPVNVVLKLFGKHLRRKYTLYRLRRRLTAETLTDIQRMEPRSELIKALPVIFAEDLSAAMSMSSRYERLVLFLDSHEAFWGHDRQIPSAAYYERDEWIRRLLSAIDYSSGIRVVFAGREPPRWAFAARWPIPNKLVDKRPLTELPTADGRAYLERAGISERRIRECLLEYARVRRNRIHPLYLGLCADVVLTAEAKGRTIEPKDFKHSKEASEKGAVLIEKLLSYADPDTDHAVRALSACRLFDRKIYLHLAEELKFKGTLAGFETLTAFSFVWRRQRRETVWFSIHDLLRRLFYEQGDEITRRADETLEKYFRALAAQGEELNVADAIYHSNRVDWKRGVDEWVELFEKSVDQGRFNLCNALLEVVGALSIKRNLEAARVAGCLGHYYSIIARYEESEQKFLEAISLFNKGIRQSQDPWIYDQKGLALSRLGDLYAETSNCDAAVKAYRRALASFTRAIAKLPKDPSPLNNKASALSALGELEFRLSQYKSAAKHYAESLVTYEIALQHSPNYVDTYSNKGESLISIGEMESELSEYAKAARTFREAVSTCDTALELSPNSSIPLNNKANALVSLGEVQSVLSDFQGARASYDNAVRVYDEILVQEPADVVALVNKANALIAAGDLELLFSRHEEAAAWYQSSIEILDRVLGVSPNDAVALSHKGRALGLIAQVRFEQASYEEAERLYEQAIRFYDQLVTLYPDDKASGLHKANLLAGLAELQVELRDEPKAIGTYKRATTLLDKVLHEMPNDVTALGNQAIILRELGEAYANISKYEQASACFWRAITSNEVALKQAPSDLGVIDNQAETFKNLGDLQSLLSQREEAFESLRKSLAAYDRILKHAPDNFEAHRGKGDVFASIGEIQSEDSRYKTASETFKLALDAYEQALKNAPNDVRAQLGIGNVLLERGGMEIELSAYGTAMQSLTESLATYDQLILQAGPYLSAYDGRAHALLRIANLHMEMGRYEEAARTYQSVIETCEHALTLSEQTGSMPAVKACALNGLGYVQFRLGRAVESKTNLNNARALFDELVGDSPEDPTLLFNMAEILCDLAEAQVMESDYEAADGLYKRAIRLCAEALARTPSDHAIRLQAADALRGLGDLQVILGQYDRAKISYKKSVAECGAVISNSPTNPKALSKRAAALHKLTEARLETRRLNESPAMVLFEEAIADCDLAIETAPDDIEAKICKASVLLSIAKVRIKVSGEEAGKRFLEAGILLAQEAKAIAPDKKEVNDQIEQLKTALKNEEHPDLE